MTSTADAHLRHCLLARRSAIAERWYQTVARTGFITRGATEVRQLFATLTEQVIELLFAEPFNHQQAQAIGATIAHVMYASPEALGRTQEVLVQEFGGAHSAALHAHLALLLSEIAIGFTRYVRTTVLAEQEQLRAALVEQRKQVEAALRAQEHRLRLVVSSAPIILFALDCRGVVTLAEGKGLSVLGLTSEAVTGQSILDITSSTPHIVENIQRALAGEAFTDIVEVATLVFETRYAPLRDEQDG